MTYFLPHGSENNLIAGGHHFLEKGNRVAVKGKDELYVALHDGTIKRSTDSGSTWSVRSSP